MRDEQTLQDVCEEAKSPREQRNLAYEKQISV